MLVPVDANSESGAEVIATACSPCRQNGSRAAAYVNLVGLVELDDPETQAGRINSWGADELHLYHFGLANERQLRLFSRLASPAA